jgi:hypothetical protein
MPRRIGDPKDKLERVVSTKLPQTHYKILQDYARDFYVERRINQPNTSSMLRYIIDRWIDDVGIEGWPTKSKP